VRKLIRREKLRAIKRSERNTLIPRPAFNAYVRKLNGDASQPLGLAVAEGALADRVAAFTLQAGKEPRQWLNDWLSPEPGQDDAESMDLAVSAVGLVAEQRTEALREPMLASVTATVGPAKRHEVREEGIDGTLVIAPDTSIDAIRAPHGSRPATREEVDDLFGELPVDGEG
jgi:hypothetical protein